MTTSLLLAVMLTGQASSPAAPSDSTSRAAEALALTVEAAKSYRFELAGDEPVAIAFQPEPILRWSNPAAGEVFGSVFVWTHEGRPEVIGSLHQWYSPLTHGSHEFHSLATGPIRGMRDDQPVWESQQPGIALRRVPDQLDVAELQFARLRQMREIARQFTVQKTDREEVSQEMRLLPQPVYRYSETNASVLDGAVFVFVQGTDPEVFLLVETRPVKDRWEWQYAFARMNSVQFVAKYQDREVWRVDIWPWSKTKNGVETYTQFGPFQRSSATE